MSRTVPFGPKNKFLTFHNSLPDLHNKSEMPLTLLPTDTRIVGGILAELNEFPWMAALVYEESNGQQKIACGGSLISSNVIMTAAHCIPSTNEILSNYELTKIKIGAR